MALKYIVYDNVLLLANVEYHKEILPHNYDKDRVKGGGRFLIDRDKKEVYFYDSSFDFGGVSFEDFKAAAKNLYKPSLEGYNFRFTNAGSYAVAITSELIIERTK